MKRSSIVWQVALLAVIGCSGPSDTPVTTPAVSDTVQQTTEPVQDSVAPDSVPGDGEAVTLVSLKVPEMH